MYKINPAKYTGVTVLPSEIAEKHLILASASQLKVIIYAFSKSGDFFDAETVSKGTGISLEEVNDALSYWKDTGFVLYENEEIKFTETSSETQEKAAPEKKEEPKKRETIPLNTIVPL